jgi:undecaprenyl phosphate-alpha-L-ara4N flippase subunit ArnF
MISYLLIILVVIATLLGSIASLLLKKGAKDFNFNIYKQLKNTNLLIGITLYIIGTVAYIAALRMGDLSKVYPMTSISYVMIALLSIKFLGEKINFYKWTGIILIISGTIIISIV